RTASNNLEEKMNRVRESIIADIKNIAVAKAKEKGFALVLDSAAQSINKTPVVLYSDTSMDITEDVIKQLNASAPTQASQGTENKK
ncbi:MAG TPA: OmpH family outer membrane protein, partial [Verrucomicrobiae bacterium]|nr:OmpH family outer membrane protein [Verrucomicrobiae bacterium]